MKLMIKGLHIDELVIFLDDEEEPTEPDQEEPGKEPEQEEPKEIEPKKAESIQIEPKKIKRKPLDKGKIGALYKAGWSVAKIADEMRCGQSTIYKTIKELGL